MRTRPAESANLRTTDPPQPGDVRALSRAQNHRMLIEFSNNWRTSRRLQRRRSSKYKAGVGALPAASSTRQAPSSPRWRRLDARTGCTCAQGHW